jgi:NAD(P)-dependent dehydrogenase (short-subunit alcohol dehydrogenase family)
MPLFSRRPAHPFAGDHVLITGGSAGLGLALARAFVAGNANVTLVARNADRLASAAAELRGLACRRTGAADPWVYCKACDVTDGEQVRV